ncbi:hypothetical protein BLOT_016230 [Blomia tropicalis]|nr:hypothetical protein BLOT_016230 [Blomia tropicalis]
MEDELVWCLPSYRYRTEQKQNGLSARLWKQRPQQQVAVSVLAHEPTLQQQQFQPIGNLIETIDLTRNQSTTKMHLDDLDNDCLILVFNQFTLQQLISLRIVCRRWETVVALICRGRRSLHLFSSIEDGSLYRQFVKHYDDETKFVIDIVGNGGNLLILDNTIDRPEESSYILPKLFPNVRKLVCRCRVDLVLLLQSWPQLEYLCLYMLANGNGDDEREKLVWTHINSLKCLKSFHLFMYRCGTIDDMPVLGRLEQFSLSYYFGDIVSVLTKLGPGIRRLYLDYIPCNLDQLKQLIEIQPRLADGLTHLTVVNIRSNQSTIEDRKQFLRLICMNFIHITHLDVTFTNQMSLIELLPELVRLKKLTKLKLQISCILPEFTIHRSANQRPKPIESIKTLYLIFCKPYDGTRLHYLDKIPVIFPNVEELFIQSYNADMMPPLKTYLSQFRCLRKTNLE